MFLITQCGLRFDGVNADNEEDLIAEVDRLKVGISSEHVTLK